MLVSAGLRADRAEAQTAPSFPSVFGGSTVDASVHQSLDMNASVSAAYEDNGESQDLVQSPFEATGFYTSLNGSLGYLWEGKRVQVGANVGTEERYYQQQRQFIGVNQYVGAGIAASFARRTTLAVNQTVNYSPAYFSGIFPGAPTTAPGAVSVRGGDYASSAFNALSYETSASVGHGITRTGTLSFSSSVRHTAFEEVSGYDDLHSYSIGGRYTQRVSRNTSLRAGYTYREGQYAFLRTGGNSAIHDLDIGVDYGRALSLFRRTELTFGVGSSVLRQPLDGVEGLQYRVVGNVNLNHELSRTWRAQLAYTRGFGFMDGLPEPVFSDGVTGSVSGFVNRRIDVSASGGFTNGDVGIAAGDNRLQAYTANARTRIALARNLEASVEYVYYRYDIGAAVVLPLGVNQFHERSSVRGGLSLWLPFVRR